MSWLWAKRCKKCLNRQAYILIHTVLKAVDVPPFLKIYPVASRSCFWSFPFPSEETERVQSHDMCREDRLPIFNMALRGQWCLAYNHTWEIMGVIFIPMAWYAWVTFYALTASSQSCPVLGWGWWNLYWWKRPFCSWSVVQRLSKTIKDWMISISLPLMSMVFWSDRLVRSNILQELWCPLVLDLRPDHSRRTHWWCVFRCGLSLVAEVVLMVWCGITPQVGWWCFNSSENLKTWNSRTCIAHSRAILQPHAGNYDYSIL